MVLGWSWSVAEYVLETLSTSHGVLKLTQFLMKLQWSQTGYCTKPETKPYVAIYIWNTLFFIRTFLFIQECEAEKCPKI